MIEARKSDCNDVHYLLVDPFGRKDSGVTTYTQAALARISNLGIKALVITIFPSEGLEEFCRRVAKKVCSYPNLLCVEVPETLSVSQYIPDGIPLHIRLHCSRSLGALIQGLPFRSADVAKEQREISRATYVSSPSVGGLLASRTLFDIREEVFVYPNPMPQIELDKLSKRSKYDVLFVGRLQSLKGCEYIPVLAKARPDLSFLVGAPVDSKLDNGNLKNITFVDGTAIDKTSLYSSAKILVLPSIFETSSMVGLEAFACGIPVVTWSHIGLAEYTAEPWLYRARHGDLDKVLQNIDAALAMEKINNVENPLKKINASFDDGVIAILSGKKQFLAKLEELLAFEKNFIQEVLCNIDKTMHKKSVEMSTIKRKYRKLIRDPKSFFRDMEIIRTIYRIARSSSAELPTNSSLHGAKEERGENIFLSANPEPVNTGWILDKHIDTPRLGDIQQHGKIEINEPPAKPVGLITGLIHSKNADMRVIEDLLSGLNSFHDFSYVGKEKLLVGSFDVDANHSTLEFLNRIDLNNKKKLSKLSNLILIDPPISLCRALRSSSTFQRTIVVLTEIREDIIPDPLCVDALITIGNVPVDGLQGFRRKLHINTITALPKALRRILQEAFPRSPDMLVPIYNCNDLQRDRFLKFDPKIYQGIIHLNSKIIPAATCMDDLCEILASQVSSIAVLESVYMRYRSLCEEIERGISPAQLLKFCLYDGVLLNVEHA
jgi:glycosyltransferase involved in cell wall biosynthesis